MRYNEHVLGQQVQDREQKLGLASWEVYDGDDVEDGVESEGVNKKK